MEKSGAVLIKPILLTLLLVSTPIIQASPDKNPMGCFLAFAPAPAKDTKRAYYEGRLRDIRYERELSGHDFATDGRTWINYTKKDKQLLDLKARILDRTIKLMRENGK